MHLGNARAAADFSCACFLADAWGVGQDVRLDVCELLRAAEGWLDFPILLRPEQ